MPFPVASRGVRRIRTAAATVVPSLIVTLVLATAHANAAPPIVYYSFDDDGVPPAATPILVSGGTQTLHLYLQTGPIASSAGEACRVGTGDEVCAIEAVITTPVGLTLVDFVPASDLVFDLTPTTLTLVGGEPLDGDLGVTKLGDLEIDKGAEGDVELVAGASVGADLTVEALSSTTLLRVPEPLAGTLLTFGVMGLVCLSRRRSRTNARRSLVAFLLPLTGFMIAVAIPLLEAGPASAQIVPPDCRCGDVDGDGIVGRGDVLELRRFLVGAIPQLSEPDKCPLLPGGSCDVTSFVALRRALARRDPDLEQTCPAALAPSCPLPDEPFDISCPNDPLPAAAFPNVCEVDAVGAAGLRIRGTILAAGGIYRGGEVLIDDAGEIVCTSCDCSAEPEAATASVVTCGEGVVSPGLINPLARANFAGNTALSSPPADYDDRHEWRFGDGPKPALLLASGASTDLQRAYELRHLMSGTTASARGTIGGFTRDLDRPGSLGIEPVSIDSFPLGNVGGDELVGSCAYPNPIEPGDVVDETALMLDVAQGVSAEAANEFVCLSQPPNDIFPNAAPRLSPAGLGALTGSQYATLRAGGSVPHLTLRNDGFLYGNVASITALTAAGVPIAVATDNPRSGAFSQLSELACADWMSQTRFGGVLSDRDLWLAATANAALATTSELRIGTLKPGRVGDLAIFDARLRSDYRAIVEADSEDVRLVVRGGELLYGEFDVMTALADATCEPFFVCGDVRRACVESEFGDGTTLGDLESAIAPFGSLENCGSAVEPICRLDRAEYPSGITATDADGDGIPDASDLCPSVFAPIRPFEQGLQADADSDGRGDACDPCPVDPLDDCDLLFAADLDHDGEINETDNCPGTPNPDQLDADGDGVGDACTPTSPLALPVPVVRNASDPGFPGFGADVVIEDVWVTAVLPDGGLFVQDDSLLPFSGVEVSPPASGSAARGNRVRVEGQVTSFFGDVVIDAATVTLLDPGVGLPFPPLDVDPADVATGGSSVPALESMLLRIGPVSITNPNPDAPDDEDRFTVTGGLLIDDRAFPELDNLAPVATPFDSITGVLDYSGTSSVEALQPRDGDDLETTAPRELAMIEPATLSMLPLATADLAVRLTLPAGAAGELVTLTTAPGLSGSVPPSVLVPAGSLSASFQFTSLATQGSETVTASLGSSMASATVAVTEPVFSGFVINEVDYDQPGIDDAEFIEIFNGTAGAIDLTDVVLVLINGGSGNDYEQIPLAPIGTLASGEYLVVGAPSVLGALPSGVASLALPGSIQNGGSAGDGVALLDFSTFEVFDVLSYEAAITTADVTSFGFVNLVEGTLATAQDASVAGSMSRIPSGSDTDDADTDWNFSSPPTPGALNF